MSNLYYQSSYGIGNEVINDEVLKPDRNLPESHRVWNDREFTLFIFGDAVELSKAKSPLFPCRDLIANLHCTYVGRDRENLPSGHLVDACECANTLNFGDKKEVIVIDGTVDTTADDFGELVSNVFGIVSEEAEIHFNSSLDIVVYWYFSKEDYAEVKKFKYGSWGSSVKFYDECNAIMMFL